MYIRSIALVDGNFSGDDAYLGAIPAIRGLGRLDISASPVTFFIGDNGSGKSTLLEAVAIASGFNPEGGSINLRFSSMDTHSGLYRRLKLIREPYRPQDGYFLRAESFYNMASAIDEVDEDHTLIPSYGGKSLHRQSHGESFLALVLNRLGGRGLYIFDEPEAALSPSRQMTLLCALHRLAENRSQILIATHSPILMAYPGATIYQLGEAGIAPVAYEDTEHYRITRSFLQNPRHMLDILLADG
ncbi:MAG: ATP-binding cassette domain-containing protein [Clostridia bacterium]|nr:ATP-binding cassette domain-containing protein [Clostridia bacterium]